MSIPLPLGSGDEQERTVSLEAHLRETGCLPRPSFTGQERAAASVNWADNFPDAPVLSDEAISRNSLHPDRW